MEEGCERNAPSGLPPEKTRTNCLGGWVQPRAGLDRSGKTRHKRDSISDPSSP
jgi:hypothetical protein